MAVEVVRDQMVGMVGTVKPIVMLTLQLPMLLLLRVLSLPTLGLGELVGEVGDVQQSMIKHLIAQLQEAIHLLVLLVLLG